MPQLKVVTDAPSTSASFSSPKASGTPRRPRAARLRLGHAEAARQHAKTAERLRALATGAPAPGLPRALRPASAAAAPHSPGPAAAAGEASFASKTHTFYRLLRDAPAYRRTMVAAWFHTAGNGMLNASYMALLASIGGGSPSRSFLAIAVKDLGQSAVFGAVNILGSHRIDGARPINDAEDATRRRGFLRELRAMCWADAGIAIGLVGVGMACSSAGISPLLLTGTLVGLRLCLACKAVYEMSLIPCVRQLLGQQTLGDKITPADRMIPSLEGMISMMTYEAVSCTVQFAIFAQATSLIVPCAMGVAVGGALLSGLPKVFLLAADKADALAPAPTSEAKG